MTAQIMRATFSLEVIGSTMRVFGSWLVRALDAFGRARSRNAVTQSQLRKARREIDHYRRLMHAGRKSPARMAR